MADSPASSEASPDDSRPRQGAGTRAVEVDVKVVERLSHLSLTATNAVEGFLSGRHRSPRRGVSVEFVERRQYVQGDDLRHLDWKAYARTDRLSIKRYEEETSLECTLVVDASGSMAYPASGEPSKYDYACTVAACLAHLVLRERDGAAIALFDHELDRVLPASTSPAHIEPILRCLAEREPAGETDIGTVLEHMTERIARPGIVVLVSDLFGDTKSLTHGLSRLAAAKHDTIVLHVLHGDELRFPFDRMTRFEDLELDERLTVDAASLRTSYLQVLQTWCNEVRRVCHVRGVDYQLLDTSTPLDVALSAYLGARMSRLGAGR